MEERGTFVSVTGAELERRIWPAQAAPRGVVQLVHGMAEHIDRYDDTARALSAAGFTVVGHTHLGHGTRAATKGYFAPEGGWEALVADVHALRVQCQAEFGRLPYFLLGHSMGSFVVRSYCLRHESGLSGVVLSGTGHFETPQLALGSGLAALLCAVGRARKPSPLLQRLSSVGYLKRYEQVRTPFDWLSRDPDQVARYVADPECGFPFTAGGYRDMFNGLKGLLPQKLTGLRPEVPVLLFSGDMDPVGGFGAGVKAVAEELRAAGVEEVEVKLYLGGRHEMFNELNRQEVWDDLIAWLERHV